LFSRSAFANRTAALSGAFRNTFGLTEASSPSRARPLSLQQQDRVYQKERAFAKAFLCSELVLLLLIGFFSFGETVEGRQGTWQALRWPVALLPPSAQRVRSRWIP